MYKSGTSWLLHCLAAHPEILAWREFDPYKAAFRRRSARYALYMLARRPDLAYRESQYTPRSRDDAFTDFLLGRGWAPVYGDESQLRAAALIPQSEEELPLVAEKLSGLLGMTFRPERAPLFAPEKFTFTLGIENYRRTDVLDLMLALFRCNSGRDMPTTFYRHVIGLADANAVVAFKAADQAPFLPMLMRDFPNTKAVAIVRDVRDAFVSAMKFEDLMRRVEAPWRITSRTKLIRFVYAWRMRAAMLKAEASSGRVLVVRYEDLHSNFGDVCGQVFKYIGVDHSHETIESVRQITDFERVSGGRKRGEEAESVVRKGVVGDWKTALTPAESELAWYLARRELTALGYDRHGA